MVSQSTVPGLFFWLSCFFHDENFTLGCTVSHLFGYKVGIRIYKLVMFGRADIDFESSSEWCTLNPHIFRLFLVRMIN